MTLQLGDTAPDFTARTTEGEISFHEWMGDGWAVLFSHPKDFTPVCTTELGTVAKLKDEFEKRNVKVIGLSVDPVSDHEAWARDIEETQGVAPNFPLIGDDDMKIAKLYGMIHPNVNGTSEGRTAADNMTVRTVFVIGPDKSIKLMLTYPMATGRNFHEILRAIDSLQLTRPTPGRHPRGMETGRRRHRVAIADRRSGEPAVPERLERNDALFADRQTTRCLIPGPAHERGAAALQPPFFISAFHPEVKSPAGAVPLKAVSDAHAQFLRRVVRFPPADITDR